jgi:hypothetical protein
VPLTQVAIPSELDVNGALGYGFLKTPAILDIKSPAGERFSRSTIQVQREATARLAAHPVSSLFRKQ